MLINVKREYDLKEFQKIIKEIQSIVDANLLL